MTRSVIGLIKPRGGEEPPSNGWKNLIPLLAPAVVQAPRNSQAWQGLDHLLVACLIHSVARFPWLNHLALAAIIYSEDGIAHPAGVIRRAHNFLRWAIPKHSASLAELDPAKALVEYYGDPIQPRGQLAYSAYHSLQLHTQAHLQSLSPEQRARLTPFLLPTLTLTPQLSRLSMHVIGQSRAHRKEQAFVVARELPALLALGRRRYRWLAELESNVRSVADLVQKGQTTLPAIIRCSDVDACQTLTFRVWDRPHWIQAHAAAYDEQSLQISTDSDAKLFLQLIGDPSDNSWFLRAVQQGVFLHTLPAEARQYMKDWHLPCLKMGVPAGLLSSNISQGRVLGWARRVAAGTPEDSRILFAVEPFLAGAAVGLFTLVCLAQTGMRIGELMQVTLDRECMEAGFFPQFDDARQVWRKGPRQFYWRLFPKGSTGRERYPVTNLMLEALAVLIDLHKRYLGTDHLDPVPPLAENGFSHTRRFSGKHKFVLQWSGQQLSIRAIENCLDFLLLEHLCRDPQSRPTRITSHLLRHGVAGWLRQQGIPLDDIMALLKQVNIAVTDYYSQLSPQDLFQKIGPALTALADLAEIDPATIRSVGELESLAQSALKRYGVLRRTPGGDCAIFTPCEVQFKCASCPHFIPDPARRQEIEEKIASHSQAKRLFEEMGDHLQADVQQAHGRAWERIAKEVDALAAVELISSPAGRLLKDFGLDTSGEELLVHLNSAPQLPAGDKKTHG